MKSNSARKTSRNTLRDRTRRLKTSLRSLPQPYYRVAVAGCRLAEVLAEAAASRPTADDVDRSVIDALLGGEQDAGNEPEDGADDARKPDGSG